MQLRALFFVENELFKGKRVPFRRRFYPNKKTIQNVISFVKRQQTCIADVEERTIEDDLYSNGQEDDTENNSNQPVISGASESEEFAKKQETLCHNLEMLHGQCCELTEGISLVDEVNDQVQVLLNMVTKYCPRNKREQSAKSLARRRKKIASKQESCTEQFSLAVEQDIVATSLFEVEIITTDNRKS